MADHNHNHHHHLHRPNRITLPPKSNSPFYPPTTTPTPTPSKHRLSISSKHQSTSSFSTFLLLFLSFRSLYSLLPFLKSSPISFSIFPFSFLVSLLSLLLTLSFSLFSKKSKVYPFSFTNTQKSKFIFYKAFILAVVFLTRFQALMYCGTAAMILAELTGNLAARFLIEGKNRIFGTKVRGFVALVTGLVLLSLSWDRVGCFPLSFVNWSGENGFKVVPNSSCLRVWQMLLPFFAGFLGCYERVLSNGKELRELGRKKVRLVTLFFTTIVLFVPAFVSMVLFEVEGDSVSMSGLGWPLANTVVFGVLLSENYNEDRVAGLKDFRKEYLVTFVCTLVLELFYFPELSLWGLLICGLLLWVSVRELDPNYDYHELGSESSASFSAAVMKSIRHILSERKSRKIALFLLINTAYMVVEFMVGFMSNSLGLISDACHMLFDCAALAIGLYASYISRLPANGQFNYGRGRFEVLSGYVNAVFLVLVGALITLESFERILDPQEISTSSLLSVSIGGLVVNIVGLIFFHEEHHHAHGGSGSCSHSHSHSHSDDHSHAHVHDHDSSECIALVQDHSQELGSNHDSMDHKHHNCKNHHHSDSADPHNHQVDQQDHHHHTVNQPDHQVNHIHNAHHANQHNDHHQHDHHNHHVLHSHHVDQHDHHSHHVDQHDHHSHHVDQHDHHSHHVDQHDHHNHHVDQHDHHHHGYTHANQHNHSHGQSQTPVRKEKHHHHIDHNMQGIFLHVLADTMGSVGVVISTLLIKYKGWLVADPACSIFISVLIVASVIQLLRNSGEILLQRVPRSCELDIKEALKDVMKLKGVLGIQNMHVWSFTNTDVVGTIHIHVSSGTDKLSVKKQVSRLLHDSGVKDLTVQIECVGYS